MRRWSNGGRERGRSRGVIERHFVSLSLLGGAILGAALAPGRSATATTCKGPIPFLHLELESVTVDGIAVDAPAEAWAGLMQIPDPDRRAGSMEVSIHYPWSDEWDLRGTYDWSNR